MCEPATIIMAVTAVVGAVTSIKASNDQADYQNAVGKNNAISAEYAAKDSLDRGIVEEDKQRNRTRALMAQQRASMAANGIDGTTGTGSLLLADSAAMGEFDALTVRNNALKGAYGLGVQADNMRAEGQNALIKGQNQAIGTVLTAGSQVYGMGKTAGYWGGAKK